MDNRATSPKVAASEQAGTDSVCMSNRPSSRAGTDEGLDGGGSVSMPPPAPPADMQDTPTAKRTFLASLPCDADRVLAALTSIEDAWWVAAAAVAAVRTGTAWLAIDAERVLRHALERTAAFDEEVQAAVADAKARRTAGTDMTEHLLAWLDADAARLPRVVLRRKLWRMRWLLTIPISRSRSAVVDTDLARLTDIPFLEHAQALCLAGNERGVRALLGTHATVARTLYAHRFALLHMLLTSGGVSPERLLSLRLLPGTHLPVEDRESGAWVDALAPPPSTTAALWVEHPAVVSALALRGSAVHPVPPPPPPPALSDWYTDVMSELEGRWGLVDAALALAHAGERLGLVPLRAASKELAFLYMLVYELETSNDVWDVAKLRRARAADLVRVVVSQPTPPHDTAARLHDFVLPFLQRGTYADAHAFHACTPSALGVHMALMALDTLPPTHALPLIVAMLARTWLDSYDRTRLVLAIVRTCDAADRQALRMYTELVHMLGESEVESDASALFLVLGTLPDADARSVCKRLDVAAQDMLYACVPCVRALVDMTHALSMGVHAPRYFWADDAQRRRAHSFVAELVQHALAQRGNERRAVEHIIESMAPWLGHDAPYLPTSCVRTLFRHILVARKPVIFNEVVQSLPHTCAAVAAHMSRDAAEALVLETARAWMDQAQSCDPLQGPLQRARDALEAVPHTPHIQAELRLLDLCARVHEFGWPGEPLTPPAVRAMPDKLILFARVLAFHRDAYRSANIMALAHACVTCDGKETSENDARIMAMLADAAAASGDLATARRECERLVARVSRMDRERDADAFDMAWRTCLQLAKHPRWPDEQARLGILSHALCFAPPAHLPAVLAAVADVPPNAGVPHVSRREDRATSAWARLLARPSTTHEARNDAPHARTTAQLLDTVATQHAPHAARMARSLFDQLGAAGWWSSDSSSAHTRT